MIDGPSASFAIGLPPEEAVAYLERKGAQVTGGWRTWLDGQHARAFTVANVAKLDVLQDIQASLAKALKEGQTFEQWKEGLVPELRKKGWWRREATNEQLKAAGRLTPDGEIKKGLTPYRLRTIFQTNMQSAYMAGRYQQMVEQADERPFWQYVAVLDSRTRPAHRAMDGKVFRYDDAAWGSIYPPNGFGCRCRVRNLSQRDMTRGKLQLSSQIGNFKPDAGFGGNQGSAIVSLLDTKLMDAPAALGTRLATDLMQQPNVRTAVLANYRAEMQPVFDAVDEATGRLAKGAAVKPTGKRVWVGQLTENTVEALGKAGVAADSSAITLTDRDLAHALRGAKKQPLPVSWLWDLPSYVSDPAATLLELATGRVLLMFAQPGERQAKLVLEITLGKGGNRLVTGTLVDPAGMRRADYQVLDGAWE